MGDDVSRQKVGELLGEYKNLKRTASGLIYFITTAEGKRFAKQIEGIKYHYENPTLIPLDQSHVGTLKTVLPIIRKDIEKLSEERGL